MYDYTGWQSVFVKCYFEVEVKGQVGFVFCVALWMVLMSVCRRWMSREGCWRHLVVSYQSDPSLKATVTNCAGRTK